ncbi:MAG: DUF434 domain-containing protein [Methanomicrobiales archaeon]
MTNMYHKKENRNIKSAKVDLRFLLNRGYRKKNALTFVANKYLLNKSQRHLLARTVFSRELSENRIKKKVNIEQIKNQNVIVDGYNVLITVESICQGDIENIVMGDDEFLRDLNAVFGKYKYNKQTEKALKKIIDILSKHETFYVYILFDKQVSFSGKLGHFTKEIMAKNKLKGEVILSKNVDSKIKNLSESLNGIVATSDGIIIDKVEKVVDLPYHILNYTLNKN